MSGPLRSVEGAALHRQAALQLVSAGARLAAAGLILPGEGNLSVRLDSGSCLITPTGADKGCLDAAQLVVMPLDEEQVPQGASVESAMHVAVYRRYPRVRAIVHAHPPRLQTLSVRGLLPDCDLLLEGRELLGRMAWVAALTPGSVELACAVADALATTPAALLDRHGAVTVGCNVAEAMRRMLLAERMALLTLEAARR